MNGELLAVLDHIERERGINKEVLIQAVEQALVSAVKKVVNIQPGIEVRVQINLETGKIKVFAGKEEVKSEDFGRIAAQTAKQVIIQKIREAEKDVIFNEFQGKVGEIASGAVYRFDRDNIIVDLLGKTEGLLPHREQCPNEKFRQGDRIKTYVLEVRKQSRGPQVVLSRSHPNFVRKLFELEVPEIYEGIVEIKSIARQAGERTKIAVWSKDEKIDCLGACVGMRGSRVKNIVNELHGEKIDIVRYKEDMKDYIASALSPAKIAQINLDKDRHRAEVIVDDDQLSLCIGKQGQNVRLASRLIGWELDIRAKEVLVKTQAVAPKEEFVQIEGVGEKLKKELIQRGFDSLEKLANAAIEELTQIKGIGKVKAEKIIKNAKTNLEKS